MKDLFGADSGAVFSEDRRYRYVLWRTWNTAQSRCMFICLNPSTADERENDKTTKRVINFSTSFGYGGVVLVNLFAVCTKSPKIMLNHPKPIGEDNDKWIQKYANELPAIFCGWGTKGGHQCRDQDVLRVLPAEKLWCLAITKDGYPGHPLYIKGSNSPRRLTNSRG